MQWILVAQHALLLVLWSLQLEQDDWQIQIEALAIFLIVFIVFGYLVHYHTANTRQFHCPQNDEERLTLRITSHLCIWRIVKRKSQTTSIIGIPISTRNPPLSRSRIPVNCLVFAGYWNASFTHKASRITFLLGYLGCSNCTPTVTLLRLAFSISL